MAELIAEASLIEKKHTRRYQTEKLELSIWTKVEVFEELEQSTTALKTSFASRKNAPCG